MHTISMGTHTGTHIDAPCHFTPGGQSIDQIPLDVLHGPALVVDLTHKRAKELITWKEDLSPYASQMHPGVIVLLHTGWPRYWAKSPVYFDHPFVDPPAATEMLNRGVLVLGMDIPSPDETGQPGHPLHQIFLGAGGCLVENMTNLDKLGGMKPPMVHLAPINIVRSDGAPVRAVAWDESGSQ